MCDNHRTTAAWRTLFKHAGVALIGGPAILLAMMTRASMALAGGLALPAPAAIHSQIGGGDNVESALVGASWDLPWQHENHWGRWQSYLDLSLGRWEIPHDVRRGHHGVTQIGVKPVLRLWLKRWPSVFVEAGIGANLISPHYSNGWRNFSTSFEFGDHVAVGWQLGPARRHELALRLEHFSNAGIKHPNPGENFIQLRYAFRL